MSQQYYPYPSVDSNPSFPDIEQRILKKWQIEKTFEKSIKGNAEFIFYDGPPFANGLPHYGHLLTGFIKDVFARYQTICGNKVERRSGWDCHGLPAELAAEKELKISGKKEIEEFGIAKFNEYCRTSVLKYTKEWESYVNRQARWVDFTNGYKTMEPTYMESVLWVFKTLYDKGLIYQSIRVMPYSWACQTPVSDFETRLDNSYRAKQSKAVTVTFKLESTPSFLSDRYSDVRLLAWTTTTWTLPSNLAVAVGREIEYVCIEREGVCYIIAKGLASKYKKEIGENVVAEFPGSSLVGYKYSPLFPYFQDHAGAFRVLDAEFVTIEDGTGIVHIAPGFGEDDQVLCSANNIELVCPVDNVGKFTLPVTDYLGKQVFEANDEIIIYLKKKKLWIRTEQYTHNYPHCWRTDTPLIYKAVPSWYLKVTAIREQMVANNQKINWVPAHIKNGLFGKWLESARDWSISRNRYWGCPVPIWQSDDPQYPHTEVYGSIAEIESAFGVKVPDLHKPFIDTLTRQNPSDPTGKSMLRRVPEILDCWFESGSMPYAQVHYPFENKEWFESHAPADFVAEYLAQTRGWFYAMVVLSVALFNQPPFLNCICHGVILGEGGQKLSKRLQNYADPSVVFENLGADAMRWFMISSPVMRGQELVIGKDASAIKEVLRLVIKPLWNAYNFFILYANIDKVNAIFDSSSGNVLDQYIIAKCYQTVLVVKKGMDEYDTVTATKAVEEFLEVLNNWYIRRSRERFWRSQRDEDKISAYNTLYSVLILLCRAISPLLPLITEEIYSGLNTASAARDKGEASVHLQNFPIVEPSQINVQVISNMEKVRSACNAALHIRSEAGIRIRQPLAKVTLIGVSETPFSSSLKQLILDETNVKSWENLEKKEVEKYATFKLRLNLPQIGKRVPHKVNQIIKASKDGSWLLEGCAVKIVDEALMPEEYELKLEAKPEFAANVYPLADQDALVLLDITITPQLRQEGFARDIVRGIQQARKEAGFNVADHIKTSMQVDDQEVIDAIEAWSQYIKEQTLSNSLDLVSKPFESINAVAHKATIAVGEVEVVLYICY